MNVYARFEEKPKAVLHTPVGDYDACASAYEKTRNNWPSVMFILHILPTKNAPEYEWMRTFSSIHGLIRQGVLLENALDRFSSIFGEGGSPREVFVNVAQWIARASSKLCLDKDPTCKPYDIRVGYGNSQNLNLKFDQSAARTAVNKVLSGSQNLAIVHGKESAVRATGFPITLNEFGVAQLFHGLTVTAVNMDPHSHGATVTFRTKFLAYQACLLNGKRLDRVHTLYVEPLSDEVKEKILLIECAK